MSSDEVGSINTGMMGLISMFNVFHELVVMDFLAIAAPPPSTTLHILRNAQVLINTPPPTFTGGGREY